jgi:hypothetical protein
MLFERPVIDHAWDDDPLLGEILDYTDALRREDVVRGAPGSTFAPALDPRDAFPASAWLLLGDRASYPDVEELTDLVNDGDVGIFDHLWTAAKQTQAGDLALMYFMAPDKAVHFVTRAASDAFFARDIEVNAETVVADTQRWAYFTPPIRIEPIPFRVLQAASDDHLILRGRSGKFLRPQTIDMLTFKAVDSEEQAELDRIVQTPVGRADLPDPLLIDLEVWREISAGALPLEAHVETHIVEPLIRSLLPNGIEWRRQYRTGAGVVDYVVMEADRPRAAIEVKLAIPRPPSGDWAATPEFQQVRRYVDALQVPGLLVDAHRVLLLDPGATAPFRVVERRSASADDYAAIRSHIIG